MNVLHTLRVNVVSSLDVVVHDFYLFFHALSLLCPLIDVRNTLEPGQIIQHQVNFASRTFIADVLESSLILLGDVTLVFNQFVESHMMSCI